MESTLAMAIRHSKLNMLQLLLKTPKFTTPSSIRFITASFDALARKYPFELCALATHATPHQSIRSLAFRHALAIAHARKPPTRT